jgi:hypothetical protein
MKTANMKQLLTVVAAVTCGSQLAQAEEFRLVPVDTASVCQSGTKTESMTLEGPGDTSIAQAEGDKLNVAVCTGTDSVVLVQWHAGGSWKSSGNVNSGCAEILGASDVKVRPVASGDHLTATYYSCVQQ